MNNTPTSTNTVAPSSASSSTYFPVSPFFSSNKKSIWIIVLVLLVVFCSAGFMYFFKSTKGGKNTTNSAKPIPVATATAKTADVPVYVNGLGTVTPLATVIVKPRVDGEIMKMYFNEGQMVKRGDVLAEIDPRPYEAALTQAEGQLMRDKALLADAKLNLTRYQNLLKQDSIASQQVDTQQALVHQYEGTVKIDTGLLATAKLNLVYTKVIAPVSGRVGLRHVDVGNIAHASDVDGLAVITQLQPMSVLFSLPEDSIPTLLKKMSSDSQLAVTAFDRAFKEKITSGVLQAVDNQIDSTTGMVKLRAKFDNKEGRLFPNQFVNAQVLLAIKRNVVTIPSAAVQYGKAGSFVFRVAKNHTVSQRDVVIGTVQGATSEIVSGLVSGDMVVVDGVDKLRDGTKVDISSYDQGVAKGPEGPRGPQT